MGFDETVSQITQIGLEWHKEVLLANTDLNSQYIDETIGDIGEELGPALIVSAGPSLYRQKILSRLGGFKDTLIATDGAYIQCLRAKLVPDFVISLDPHPTRMVRWFGDPDFAVNSEGDDYFERQDLDITFRENAARTNEENIELVNDNAWRTKFIVSTSCPRNVIERIWAAGGSLIWFVPLVDSPVAGSLTEQMCEMAQAKAMNTGGTVGTAAWVFAHSILKSQNIAVVGMDFGYPLGTPLEKTQSWHMLGGSSAMYPRKTGYWGESFTDPTYWWYLQNFLGLLKANTARIVNCSGEGLLCGNGVTCMELEDWLRSFS